MRILIHIILDIIENALFIGLQILLINGLVIRGILVNALPAAVTVPSPAKTISAPSRYSPGPGL